MLPLLCWPSAAAAAVTIKPSVVFLGSGHLLPEKERGGLPKLYLASPVPSNVHTLRKKSDQLFPNPCTKKKRATQSTTFMDPSQLRKTGNAFRTRTFQITILAENGHSRTLSVDPERTHTPRWTGSCRFSQLRIHKSNCSFAFSRRERERGKKKESAMRKLLFFPPHLFSGFLFPTSNSYGLTVWSLSARKIYGTFAHFKARKINKRTQCYQRHQ